MDYGNKVWIFPDAELPPEGVNTIAGHESVIITNVGRKDAHVKITLFYTDKEPFCDLEVKVNAQRVRCLRTNGQQYSIMLESDVPIIAQYGRAEPRTVAFYTTPGYACE